jgi:hypothetical protein
MANIITKPILESIFSQSGICSAFGKLSFWYCYGMEFREAENYGATGASEYNDVVGQVYF